MKCRDCKIVMKEMPVSFSDFGMSLLGAPSQHYCNNKDCIHFGFITVAGIKEDDKENLPEQK